MVKMIRQKPIKGRFAKQVLLFRPLSVLNNLKFYILFPIVKHHSTKGLGLETNG